MKHLFSLLLLSLLLESSFQRIGYTPITSFTDTTSKTFSDTNSNPASCSCNLKNSMCDIFCCCDSECSPTNIDKWKTAGICSSTITKTISSNKNNNNCDGSSLYSLNSYESLNCIYFHNSNTIGQYFENTTLSQIVKNKMGELMFTSSLKQRLTKDIYLPGLPVYYGSPASSILIPQTFGSDCRDQQLIFGKNISYNCLQTVNNQNCMTSIFKTLTNICRNGKLNCDLSPTTTGLNCLSTGNVDYFTMTVYVSGSQNYSITAVDITGTSNSITTGTFNLQGNINYVFADKNVAQSRSGAPGYVSGLPLTFYSSTFSPVEPNFNIRSNNNVECLNSGSSNTKSLINFLSSKNINCKFTNGCPASAPQINNLFQYPNNSAVYISRYGNALDNSNSNSADMIPITFSSRVNNTNCAYNVAKITTLNIMYSIAGSSLDYQYYLLKGHVTYVEYKDADQMKDKFATFNVKWIYVDPADVTATPTNNFYIYFSKLWNPIQNTYNSLLFEKTLLLGGLTIVVLLIIF